MDDVQQPKYLEDARADELVVQYLTKMFENKGFEGESSRTRKRLKRILSHHERNVVKYTNKAQKPPQKRTESRKKAPESSVPVFEAQQVGTGEKKTKRRR